MSLTGSTHPPRRRRGAALEDALLDAAWDELVEKGYDALTVDGVAARAHTGRAVLYRRWPSKPDLVRAAIAHNGYGVELEIPDTGDLREDLLALLRLLNATRVPVATLVTTRLGAYYADTGTNLADLREEFRAGRTIDPGLVFDRAVARGEIDPARLTPRVREVAFDLYRHEVLMTQRAVPDEVLVSIVDEVVLPLVGAG